jgi:uncharacterized protein (DUF2141 family)
MKKIIFFIIAIFIVQNSFGQTKGMNYQAVILDPTAYEIPGVFLKGHPLVQGKVVVRFTIKTGKTIEYEEIHHTQTDDYGLVNLIIGTGATTQATNSVKNSLKSLYWGGDVKSLAVAIQFQGQVTFTEVSNENFLYMPYAMYAESVEYKNVMNAPENLSYFLNDVGFLVPNDLKGIRDSLFIYQNNTKQGFSVVNQQVSVLSIRIDKQEKAVNDVNLIAQNLNSIVAQQNNVLTNLSTSAESVSNKSSATDLGNSNPSNTYYPSQRAVKTYVDAKLASVGSDASSSFVGQIRLAGDLGGTATNPTVPGLANKENWINKSSNVTLDALSDVKYPTVKAVKSYVDLATQGVSFSADLSMKAEKNSPNLTGIPTSPTAVSGTNTTQIATTAFVAAAVIVAGATPDATNSISGKILLTGDLGGSSSNPTVPGLANKESLANKSTNVTLDALSDVKYPSAKAVKSYVDLATQGVTFSADLSLKAEKNSPTLTGIPTSPTAASGTNTTQIATTAFVAAAVIVAGATPDATSSTSGKIQLAGDLSGSATAPSIANNAITTAKILDGAISDSKIATGISASKVGLGNVNNTSDADKPVSTAILTALNNKAALASPTLTGLPTSPTAAIGTNTTQIATTAFVKTAIDAAVNDADDEFSATTGQTIFMLTQLPFANSKVRMYINGIKISLTAFRMSGRQLEYLPINNGGTQLISGSRIQLEYYY